MPTRMALNLIFNFFTTPDSNLNVKSNLQKKKMNILSKKEYLLRRLLDLDSRADKDKNSFNNLILTRQTSTTKSNKVQHKDVTKRENNKNTSKNENINVKRWEKMYYHKNIQYASDLKCLATFFSLWKLVTDNTKYDMPSLLQLFDINDKEIIISQENSINLFLETKN